MSERVSDEKCIPILAGKPEGKVLVGRSKSRWENRVTELLLTRIHRYRVCGCGLDSSSELS
jgi:hypothetical protein